MSPKVICSTITPRQEPQKQKNAIASNQAKHSNQKDKSLMNSHLIFTSSNKQNLDEHLSNPKLKVSARQNGCVSS